MRSTTIKVRFIQMISVSIVMCLILIFLVTGFSWTIAQRSREVQALTTSLGDMAVQADSEYNDILKLSQNMVPTGPVGQIYDEYLAEKTQYDRFKSYGNFTNSLNIATFGMEEILLSAYYIPLEHRTWNNVLMKNVVSVLRPVTFSNNVQAYIYVEIATGVPAMLQSKEEIEGVSYIFLQTDRDGKVMYSNSDRIAVGTDITADENDMIQMNQYIGVQKESQYGFSYVLMMPVREYIHRNNRWILWIFIVVLISFAILAVV